MITLDFTTPAFNFGSKEILIFTLESFVKAYSTAITTAFVEGD